MCSEARNSFVWGARDALPIVFGYFPLAFAYGVLAAQAGLGVGATIAMSVFVYAGASQFMAISMLAAGTTPAALILTTLVVNLRHLLMSAAIGPRLERLSPPAIAAIAFHLTDESFALASVTKPASRLSVTWLRGVQWSAYLSWVCGSATGALAGAAVPDPARWGLDFALTAMFVALLVMQIRHRTSLLVAVAGAVSSRLLCMVFAGHWAVLLSAVAAATLGLAISTSGRNGDVDNTINAKAV
jgi:4-azaleucine resistance transporter AzlC